MAEAAGSSAGGGQRSSAGSITIKVKTLAPATYELDVSPEAAVLEVKQLLVGIAGMPLDRQRLIFHGRVLQDSVKLSESNVEDGHTLHLVERNPAAAAQAQVQQAGAGQARQPGSGLPGEGGAHIGFAHIDLEDGDMAGFGQMLSTILQSALGAGTIGQIGQILQISTSLGSGGPGEAAGAAAEAHGTGQEAGLEVDARPHLFTTLSDYLEFLEGVDDQNEPIPMFPGRPGTRAADSQRLLQVISQVLEDAELEEDVRGFVNASIARAVGHPTSSLTTTASGAPTAAAPSSAASGQPTRAEGSTSQSAAATTGEHPRSAPSTAVMGSPAQPSDPTSSARSQIRTAAADTATQGGMTDSIAQNNPTGPSPPAPTSPTPAPAQALTSEPAPATPQPANASTAATTTSNAAGAQPSATGTSSAGASNPAAGQPACTPAGGAQARVRAQAGAQAAGRAAPAGEQNARQGNLALPAVAGIALGDFLERSEGLLEDSTVPLIAELRELLLALSTPDFIVNGEPALPYFRDQTRYLANHLWRMGALLLELSRATATVQLALEGNIAPLSSATSMYVHPDGQGPAIPVPPSVAFGMDLGLGLPINLPGTAAAPPTTAAPGAPGAPATGAAPQPQAAGRGAGAAGQTAAGRGVGVTSGTASVPRATPAGGAQGLQPGMEPQDILAAVLGGLGITNAGGIMMGGDGDRTAVHMTVHTEQWPPQPHAGAAAHAGHAHAPRDGAHQHGRRGGAGAQVPEGPLPSPDAPIMLTLPGPAGTAMQVDVGPVARALADVIQRINPGLTALGVMPATARPQAGGQAQTGAAPGSGSHPAAAAAGTGAGSRSSPSANSAAPGSEAPSPASATSASATGQSAGALQAGAEQPAARLVAALAPIVRDLIPRVVGYVTRTAAAQGSVPHNAAAGAAGGAGPAGTQLPGGVTRAVPLVFPGGQMAFASTSTGPTPGPAGSAQPAAASSLAPAGRGSDGAAAAAQQAQQAQSFAQQAQAFAQQAQGLAQQAQRSADTNAAAADGWMDGQQAMTALQGIVSNLLARSARRPDAQPASGAAAGSSGTAAPTPSTSAPHTTTAAAPGTSAQPVQQHPPGNTTVTSGAPAPTVVIVPSAFEAAPSPAAGEGGAANPARAGAAQQGQVQDQADDLPGLEPVPDISSILAAAIPLAQGPLADLTQGTAPPPVCTASSATQSLPAQSSGTPGTASAATAPASQGSVQPPSQGSALGSLRSAPGAAGSNTPAASGRGRGLGRGLGRGGLPARPAKRAPAGTPASALPAPATAGSTPPAPQTSAAASDSAAQQQEQQQAVREMGVPAAGPSARGPAGGQGADLAGMLSSVLSSSGGGAGGASGGGGLMGLVGQMLSNPGMQDMMAQLAQSPAMQQIAQQLGEAHGGGGEHEMPAGPAGPASGVGRDVGEAGGMQASEALPGLGAIMNQLLANNAGGASGSAAGTACLSNPAAATVAGASAGAGTEAAHSTSSSQDGVSASGTARPSQGAPPDLGALMGQLLGGASQAGSQRQAAGRGTQPTPPDLGALMGQLLGGGSSGGGGGGGPNLGGLMSQMMPLVQQMLGAGSSSEARSRAAPSAEIIEDLDDEDSPLHELPDEEAANWRAVIGADRERQSHMPLPARPLSQVYQAGSLDRPISNAASQAASHDGDGDAFHDADNE